MIHHCYSSLGIRGVEKAISGLSSLFQDPEVKRKIILGEEGGGIAQPESCFLSVSVVLLRTGLCLHFHQLWPGALKLDIVRI